MRADDFRAIALSFPEAVEAAHVNHPDFRVGGKIFATLGYPDENWGVVKLTPDQQGDFIARDPEMFEAVKGAWGRRGNTQILLRAAKIDILRKALATAWRNAAPRRLVKAAK